MVNGAIYTGDGRKSRAEAVAVRDGIVVALGSGDDLSTLIGDETEVIDLGGRLAIPGIHDSHVHPLEGGYERVYCNLWNEHTRDEILAALKRCAANHNGEWFNALGLDLSAFGLHGPDKSMLDGIAPGKYIFVDGADGHSALVNDKLLELADIDADTPDPDDGVIERRAGSSEPNGTLRESARDRADKVRPARDLATSIRAMRDALKLMNSFGITSINDVWVGEHEMRVYKALDESGELTVRVTGAIIDEGVFEKHTAPELERLVAHRADYESATIRYPAIKIMVDGVFEGETGAMLEPYRSADHSGPRYHEPGELNARASRYYDSGMQLHFHAMGDRAVRDALDAIEYARATGAEEHRQLRHTISHLGLVAPADIPRFAPMNVGASFTMVWGYPTEWTVKLEIPVLGRDRVARLYPIRSLREAGAVILGGSDWNYGELNPLLSIETAITRADPHARNDRADDGYEDLGDEFVDLTTMIDAYTINGAWQTHAEDRTGSIEVGKQADFVVYDRDLFALEPREISEARVDLTVFDGRIVYRRADD